VGAQLVKVIADPAVAVVPIELGGPIAKASPLTPAVVGPVQTLVAEMWPGLPILPILQPYATDGRFLTAVGIPTYGIDASLSDRALNNMHGLNEYTGVQSLYRDRDFLYRLIKLYAGTPGST
jgi:acetylornithine deacetylase/succinyl-diaminopimelate desuccinylase-like protein